MKVAFHLIKMTDMVKRRDHVISIPQPAIPVIPVPSTSWKLGQTGSAGSYNCSGILILVDFQNQCRTDDKRLVKRCNCRLFYPGSPIPRCFCEKMFSSTFKG